MIYRKISGANSSPAEVVVPVHDLAQFCLEFFVRAGAQIGQFTAQIRQLATRVKNQGGDEGVHRRVSDRRVHGADDLRDECELVRGTGGCVVREICMENHLATDLMDHVAS